MEAMTLVREKPDTRITTTKRVNRIYLGSYMPFAGVKYYGIFTDRDIIEGRTDIGPVGWHSKAPAPDDEPAKVLLAA
ncbi:MAG: hypothetical protein BZY79_04865 [SAR202 cluster bacterium Casp-Chloro-G4]|nr:hypothetical protein [Chloroflexota bacterium]MDA1226406.1 hypothetical protein [Chloroflexota bacterium]PKB61214.1 MAG: hypothetical protein BZY79_04865 [SAR202 cluster bacterium Casp-Chloro-G4]